MIKYGNDDLKLPKIFQNGMVLQHGMPIRIWGEYKPNAILMVTLRNSSKTTQVDENGEFSFDFPSQEVSNSETLTFICDSKILSVFDVKIGEVWLLAGQSNNDFNLRFDGDFQKDPESVKGEMSEQTDVSFFEVPKKIKLDSVPDQTSKPGEWHELSGDNAGLFSAIGYYFGIKLSEYLNRCPVGLVWMSYGGTTASSWLSEQALLDDPVLNKTFVQSYKHLLATRPNGEYEAFLQMVSKQSTRPEVAPFWDRVMAGKVDHEELEDAFAHHHELFVDYVMGPESENRPHGLFDTMVSTIIGYRVKAILWYQGESDDQHAEVYDHLLTALINNWRNLWGYKFPFLIMQLAPFEDWFGSFDGTFYPEMRQKQSIVANTVSDVYITNVMDDGARFDIHPKNKKLAAQRFYYLALDKVYHEKLNGQAPKVIDETLDWNNQSIVITFDSSNYLKLDEAAFLTVTRVKINGVTMALKQVRVAGNQLFIIFEADKLHDANITVDYQQEPYSKAGLCNENNVPVRPFIINL